MREAVGRAEVGWGVDACCMVLGEAGVGVYGGVVMAGDEVLCGWVWCAAAERLRALPFGPAGSSGLVQ